MRTLAGLMGLATLVSALAACGQRDEAHAVGGSPQQPDSRPLTEPRQLPETRALDVHVEGQVEAREARIFRSPQGYAIYVLPQLEMTQEEPCCDLAFARVDDGFSMRIERIDEGRDTATLAVDMALALSSVGQAEDTDVGGHFPPEARAEVELSQRAVGDGVSVAMLVARIDGGRYRVTLHLPHREALEGIAPSMWAMLGSLRTTGERPRP